MTEQDKADAALDTLTGRLIRREALRRAAEEISTTTPAGLEGVLARISAEVTADATTARVGPKKGERPGGPRSETAADPK